MTQVKVRIEGDASLSYKLWDVLESESPAFPTGEGAMQFVAWKEGDTLLSDRTLYQMQNLVIGDADEQGCRIATFDMIPLHD